MAAKTYTPCVVARGSALMSIVVRRVATGSVQTDASTLSVFEL